MARQTLPNDEALTAIARSVTEGGVAPCAVVSAAVRRGRAWRTGAGVAGVLAPGEAAATITTAFDLASVTKPFTALAAARLAKKGVLPLATPLGDVLDEARKTPSSRVPIELFLAHRAGLDGHRPLYAPMLEGKRASRAKSLFVAASARREGCDGDPPDEGFAPVYSDLGYLLVGEALARAAGRSLDDVIEEEVAAPVGSRARAAAKLVSGDEVAPTERLAWRGGVVRAEVHDENAWAIHGRNVSGHAGLFGSAADVLALGIAILDALRGERPDWLSPNDLAPLLRERPGGTLRAGFDGKSREESSAGTRFGPRTFGHLGFTGTSLWIDPDAEVTGVLLTNRVCPTRANDAIRAARPRVYDAIWAWAFE